MSDYTTKYDVETSKGKAILVKDDRKVAKGYKKGIAIFDTILRICSLGATIGAAAAMGTIDQTLPFTTRFFKFQAGYDDIQTFQFFVIVMAIVSGYLALSLPLSILCIARPHAGGLRVLLMSLDIVMVALTTAAASSAAAIVYLAHSGNQSTNWLPICQQFNEFCNGASGAVVGSFIAMIVLVFLVLVSAVALRRG